MSFKEFDLSDYIRALEDFKASSTNEILKHWGNMQNFDMLIPFPNWLPTVGKTFLPIKCKILFDKLSHLHMEIYNFSSYSPFLPALNIQTLILYLH